MSSNPAPVILSPGVSLSVWTSDLRTALMAKGCLGHVIHSLDGIKAIHRPIKPESGDMTVEEEALATTAYEDAMEKWMEGEINATNILVLRIAEEI